MNRILSFLIAMSIGLSAQAIAGAKNAYQPNASSIVPVDYTVTQTSPLPYNSGYYQSPYQTPLQVPYQNPYQASYQYPGQCVNPYVYQNPYGYNSTLPYNVTSGLGTTGGTQQVVRTLGKSLLYSMLNR